MKTCLLCGVVAENDAATCVNDGEASWSAAVDPVAAVKIPASPKIPKGMEETPAPVVPEVPAEPVEPAEPPQEATRKTAAPRSKKS